MDVIDSRTDPAGSSGPDPEHVDPNEPAPPAGAASAATDGGLGSLTVLYDEQCAFCRHCRDWLALQPTHLPVQFLAAHAPDALRLYGEVPWLGLDLMVVAADGRTWIGPAAFILCLWATEQYRPLAFTLSRRGGTIVAERVFATISHQRGRLAAYTERRDCRRGQCRNHPVLTAQPDPLWWAP